MFLPAIEEKLKKIKETHEENRLNLPTESERLEEYYREKLEEKPPERVITIQII